MHLHRVFAVAILSHPEHGVLLTKEQIAQGNWSFIPCELNAGEDWRNALFLAIKQRTWIEYITFDKILWVQSFPEKIFTKESALVFFVHVKTNEIGHGRGYQWVRSQQEMETLALFNPLTKSLFQDALNNEASLDSYQK